MEEKYIFKFGSQFQESSPPPHFTLQFWDKFLASMKLKRILWSIWFSKYHLGSKFNFSIFNIFCFNVCNLPGCQKISCIIFFWHQQTPTTSKHYLFPNVQFWFKLQIACWLLTFKLHKKTVEFLWRLQTHLTNTHCFVHWRWLRCCEKLKRFPWRDARPALHCNALLAACCGCDQRELTVTILTSLLYCGVLTREREEGCQVRNGTGITQHYIYLRVLKLVHEAA